MNNERAQGIALIAFGGFWTLITLAGLTGCLESTGGGCALFVAPFVLIGVLLLGLGAFHLLRPPVQSPQLPAGFNPAVPPPLITPVVVRETTEVVRVRCRYCGALADPTTSACPSCGAPL